jgi:hypothetical protein
MTDSMRGAAGDRISCSMPATCAASHAVAIEAYFVRRCHEDADLRCSSPKKLAARIRNAGRTLASRDGYARHERRWREAKVALSSAEEISRRVHRRKLGSSVPRACSCAERSFFEASSPTRSPSRRLCALPLGVEYTVVNFRAPPALVHLAADAPTKRSRIFTSSSIATPHLFHVQHYTVLFYTSPRSTSVGERDGSRALRAARPQQSLLRVRLFAGRDVRQRGRASLTAAASRQASGYSWHLRPPMPRR